jgi:hypothetical protein
MPELRDEIRTVLAEHDGVFTSSALQAMKKLDSFLKETMRLNPAGSISFQRKVNKTFSLSNGQVIPAGVIIEVPSAAISHDPEVFENPDKFDPWRFARLREQARAAGEAEAAAQNQFVSVNPSVLTVCIPLYQLGPPPDCHGPRVEGGKIADKPPISSLAMDATLAPVVSLLPTRLR